MIFRLDERLLFPNPELAEPDGLLAVGGDLSANRLLLAYSHGIFPWYSDDEPILWYSPHQRFVLHPDQLKISKSMRQVLRSDKFSVTFDTCFDQVIQNCSVAFRKDQDGTWITNDMITAYVNLHQLGYAHSVEVWENNELAGGLYGIQVGRVNYTQYLIHAALNETFNHSQLTHSLIMKHFHILRPAYHFRA